MDNNGPQYPQDPQYPQASPSPQYSQGTQLTEAAEQYRSYVMGQLRAGVDPSAITQKLMGMGLDGGQAVKLVDSLKMEIGPVMKQEQLVPTSFPMAIIGGIVGAIIGGSLWGLIVILTGFEIGYAAIGVGFLCGLGVRVLAQGQSSVPFQAIAVLSSIFGIVIGNYVTIIHALRELAAKEYGPNMVNAYIPWFSGATIAKFFHVIPMVYTGKDAIFNILWIILAIGAAVKTLEKN